jgi:serine protease
MAAKQSVRWLVLGAALTALAACDAINDRMDQFGKLTGDVIKQINGDLDEAEDPLTSAPLEARALFGTVQTAVALPEQSLDELLQTQSFFAIGSVIAMPKEEMTEPVVEPESFDLAAADPATPETAQDAASELNSSDAPKPESAEAPAGPPVTEAAPKPLLAEPVPAPAPTTPPAADTKPDAGATPDRQLAIRKLPALRSATSGELRQQAQVVAPRALEKAVKDSGVTVNKESLRVARESAEKTITAKTETAQAIGDEIVLKSADGAAPVPRVLAARTKLNVPVALAARERTEKKLEQLGLSGIVTPGEGGQMRILIGVKPTQLSDKMDLTKVQTMRDLFAQKKEKASDECQGDPTVAQMQADAILATECVVKVLQATGNYQYVEKDFIFTNQFMKKPKGPKPGAVGITPNDPLFGLQWNFKTNGTAAGQSAGGASFNDFWTRAKLTGSRSVTVAVVDTGLQMNHPDIKGSANLAQGYDMVSDPTMGNDGDGQDSDPNDPGDKCDLNDPTTADSFHGTHVAGTIGVASTNNKSGIAGGDWDVTVVPVRALGRCGGKLSDINDAIRWAAGKIPARGADGKEIWNSHPADIINLSIGLFEPCPASMQAAINDAVSRGAIVVAAAGNARVDTKYFAPGGCDNVISVAAGDQRGMLTPYSNFGAKVSIMAPGGDMTRDDDSDGRPDGILSTKFSTNCYDPAQPGTKVAQCYYSYENGTSMAAPHVSAALALLKAKFPALAPSQLKDRLLAASTARAPLQCSGKCSNYPGTEAIPGSDGLCFRPCGAKMLNLSNAPVQ